ncbi:MAG: substrate-binding domain-containing protein [Calditrichaeota bacterium]|nr:substrate-binding domain-containing protein [Calditrichota bacterium]
MNFRIGLVMISLVLSLLIGLMLSRQGSGDSTSEKAARKLLIGFSMDTQKEARWQRDRDNFVRRANALGAEVLVQSANSDDTRQMQDIQSLISNHVDVLVIVPHNGQAMTSAVRLARENDIPVMAYDRMIPDCDLDLYISFDNVRIGEQQARYLVDKLPRTGSLRVVRIFGANTDNNAHLYKEGQDRVLQPYIASGRVEIVHEDWAENWKPEMAKKITNAAITRLGHHFDAILASNDGTAGGAIQALIEEGLAGKILVTGQDADLVACQRVAAGTQSMTIYKPLSRVAETAAELAYKLGSGKPIVVRDGINNGAVEVPSVLVETTTVTRENLMETVVADRFHSYEDIYRNVPEAERPGK